MSQPLRDELAALRAALERLPDEVPAGPTIPAALSDGEAHRQRADDELRWAELDRHGGEISGQRVLLVGGNLAFDADAFLRRGASYVAACEPGDAARLPD